MKKKLKWILCLLGIFLFILISVSATGSAPLLVDHADLLTDSEEQNALSIYGFTRSVIMITRSPFIMDF